MKYALTRQHKKIINFIFRKYNCIFFMRFADINTDTSKRLDKIQEMIIRSFSLYMKQMSQQCLNQDRMSKFLLKLMTLRSLESDIVEELFFKIIGPVDITNVIPYIWKLGGAGTSTLGTSPSVRSSNVST